MLPLFDLMMRAQDGKAMDALARQFNLAQEQAAKAVAALMPAFSEGLKRHSSTPVDFASLMQKASSGNYAGYFEDLTRSFTPEGLADGNRALNEIFGSKAVSSAIAAQAAQLTGIGQDILNQMMPAMADTMLGGLVKQMMGQVPGRFANPFAAGMTGQPANPFAAFASDSMGAMTQQWLEAIGLARRKPDPMQAQFQAGLQAMMDNPLGKAMQSFFDPGLSKAKSGAESGARAADNDPFSLAPWMKSLQDMMASATGAARGEEAPSASADPKEDYDSFVNTLFDSGLEVQKSYQTSLESIFDQWMAKPGQQ